MDERPREQGAEPPPQRSLLRQGLIAGWWNPMMDRYGPRSPLLRFALDVGLLIAFFLILAILYVLAK